MLQVNLSKDINNQTGTLMYNELFIKQETLNNQTKLTFHMLTKKSLLKVTSTKGEKWGHQIISIS